MPRQRMKPCAQPGCPESRLSASRIELRAVSLGSSTEQKSGVRGGHRRSHPLNARQDLSRIRSLPQEDAHTLSFDDCVVIVPEVNAVLAEHLQEQLVGGVLLDQGRRRWGRLDTRGARGRRRLRSGSRLFVATVHPVGQRAHGRDEQKHTNEHSQHDPHRADRLLRSSRWSGDLIPPPSAIPIPLPIRATLTTRIGIPTRRRHTPTVPTPTPPNKPLTSTNTQHKPLTCDDNPQRGGGRPPTKGTLSDPCQGDWDCQINGGSDLALVSCQSE